MEQLHAIKFGDKTLHTIHYDSKAYVSIRHLCAFLGINYASICRNKKANDYYECIKFDAIDKTNTKIKIFGLRLDNMSQWILAVTPEHFYDEIIFYETVLNEFWHGRNPDGYKRTDEVYVHEKKGYVYIMCDENGLIKIGKSIEPEKRMRTVETQSGYKTINKYVSIQCMNYSQIESSMHKHFGLKRKGGEWFGIDFDDAVDALKNMKYKTIYPQSEIRDMVKGAKGSSCFIRNIFAGRPQMSRLGNK